MNSSMNTMLLVALNRHQAATPHLRFMPPLCPCDMQSQEFDQPMALVLYQPHPMAGSEAGGKGQRHPD